MSEQPQEELTLWKAVLGIEFIALLIGLAMPITPSKTGRKFSVAEWLFGQASYWIDALIWFVNTNIMIGILLIIAIIWGRWAARRQ